MTISSIKILLISYTILASFLLLTLYLFKSFQLYILCAIALTVLLSISKFRSTQHILITSLILFFTLRLIFFVGTEFRILPFIDTYWDFAVVRTFLDNKEISILSDFKGGVSPLEGYSAWPLLHTLEYLFIMVTGMNPLLAHILNTLYIPLIPFIFTFLIIRLLHVKLALPLEFVYIASIFYATMPDTIYWSLQLIRNTLGWSFTSMIMFLLLRNHSNRPSYHFTAAILLLFIAIVLSHHWSSIIIISGFLLYFFSTHIKISGKQTKSDNSINNNFYITCLLFSTIILIIWWINYSNIIFEMTNFNKIISIRPTIERWVPTFPPELTSMPLILFLRAKMFLIYIPLIIGLYCIYKYYKRHPSSFIKFVFSFTFIIIFLTLFNFVINLEPTRVIVLFIPFSIVSLSFFYLQIYNINNSLKLIITYIILPFVTIISFIGIFSHSIIPSHLYSDLNPLTIGEHPTKIYINEFVKKINYSNIVNIYSDDTELLTTLLPSSQLHKIEKLPREIDERFFVYNPNRLILIMKDFFVYRYSAGGLSYISYYDALLLKEEIKTNIGKANLLYTDSYSFIYQ